MRCPWFSVLLTVGHCRDVFVGIFSMFWKSLIPIFLAKTVGAFLRMAFHGCYHCQAKSEKLFFPLKGNWESSEIQLVFLRRILPLQIFAHDAPSNDELCIWHLLLSTIFLSFLQDARIFVFLCLNPEQSLVMFVFYM